MKLLAQCEPMKFDELVELSREHGFFSWIIGDSGDLKQSEKSTLGKLLKRYDQRLFDQGHFIIKGKGRHRTFRCRPLQNETKTE